MVPTGGGVAQAPAHNGRVSDSKGAVIPAAVRVAPGGSSSNVRQTLTVAIHPRETLGSEAVLPQVRETIYAANCILVRLSHADCR